MALVWKWNIELILLRDGSVLAMGELDGRLSEALVALEHTPTALLNRLDHWLTYFEDGDITMLARHPDGSLLAWTTHSSSLALYWAATVVGKMWVSQLAPRRPAAWTRQRFVAQRSSLVP